MLIPFTGFLKIIKLVSKNSSQNPKMKATILLFALIVGCIIPTTSQINRHRKTDASTEQFSGKQNKKNDDIGTYKFVDKFSGSLSDRALDSFIMSPGLAPK